MSSEQTPTMGRRALLTERERELLSADDLDEKEMNYRYQAASRIRRKIEDELTEDIELLAENHPQLLSELREVVCKNGETNQTPKKECPECHREFTDEGLRSHFREEHSELMEYPPEVREILPEEADE